MPNSQDQWKPIQVTWRGRVFANIYEFAKAFDQSVKIAKAHYTKYNGCLDNLWPNRNSTFYDPTIQTDGHSFIAKAVKKYGIKATARAFNLSPKSVRMRRNRGTLWQLAYPSRYDDPKHNGRSSTSRVGITEEQLTALLANPPRRPYIYVLHWTKTGKKYIGSQTKQHCKPEDLFNKHFPRAKSVVEHIDKHGLPDVKFVREYPTPKQALTAHQWCLSLIGYSSNLFSQYLNTRKHISINNY